MAIRTATQTGNWSDTATWGGAAAPGDGDTAIIGAFTVTVDANTTVGTSPNDVITKVVDKTSATGALIIATGATLTVKGNIGCVNGAVFRMNAGSGLIFDAGASGGSPIYTFVNVGFQRFEANGTSGSRCTVQAVAGKTAALCVNWDFTQCTYADFTRMSVATTTANNDIIIDHCTFTSCDRLNVSTNITTNIQQYSFNVFTSSTNATQSMRIIYSAAKVSGTRMINNNVTDKYITYSADDFTVLDNYFAGWDGATGKKTAAFRNNFLYSDNTVNAGGGQIFASDVYSNYFFMQMAGNPHYTTPLAEANDIIMQRCVFEFDGPDAIDSGDCIIPHSSAGFKVNIRNCIVLPATNGKGSGVLATIYALDADRLTWFLHNTTHAANTWGTSGLCNYAEADNGVANEIPIMKSNCIWSDVVGNGFKCARIQGTVINVITASGCDYNWTYNLAAGDNGRGYEDYLNSPAQGLWAAGNATGTDAATAGVDNNGGTGNPNFYDATRNLAKWCAARGYGAQTVAAGLAAIKADTTRIKDLITYVFEGYKPTNASMRAGSHDTACVGASNYHKSARITGKAAALASTVTANYGV